MGEARRDPDEPPRRFELVGLYHDYAVRGMSRWL